jgi:hypothetical protein
VDGLVYVIGGNDGTTSLKSVECYSPVTGQWQAVPEMNSRRQGCGVTCADGLLYAVGGHDGKAFLASAEVYDPATREWQNLPKMNVPRSGCGAATVLDCCSC